MSSLSHSKPYKFEHWAFFFSFFFGIIKIGWLPSSALTDYINCNGAFQCIVNRFYFRKSIQHSDLVAQNVNFLINLQFPVRSKCLLTGVISYFAFELINDNETILTLLNSHFTKNYYLLLLLLLISFVREE